MSHPLDEVQMIRYECGTCDMVATCLANPVSELAWLDHMDIHVCKDHYRAWTWTVQALPLRSTSSST